MDQSPATDGGNEVISGVGVLLGGGGFDGRFNVGNLSPYKHV